MIKMRDLLKENDQNIDVDDYFVKKYTNQNYKLLNKMHNLNDLYGPAYDHFFKKMGKTRTLNLTDLNPTQKYVSSNKVDKISKVNNPILVFKVDEKFYIYDGHHRAIFTLNNDDVFISTILLDVDSNSKLKDAFKKMSSSK